MLSRTLIEVGLLGGREVAGVGVLVGTENDRQATQGEDRNCEELLGSAGVALREAGEPGEKALEGRFQGACKS